MQFDPNQISLLLSGVEIKDFADGADVIAVSHSGPAGAYTMGATGRGVFIANADRSGTLTLKLLQHSDDNKYLSDRLAAQRNSLKTFEPLTLEIRDLLNEDQATGLRGYFTDLPTFTRGAGHNTSTWVIAFETITIKNEKGL
ncbi:Phage-related protein [plant metagenome]|uniref:Phage-related protein n=1 Tax=plant metagenome TaxID=1297885 RepID=A0A484P2Q9_9ZZZZ